MGANHAGLSRIEANLAECSWSGRSGGMRWLGVTDTEEVTGSNPVSPTSTTPNEGSFDGCS